jgi:cytochrome b
MSATPPLVRVRVWDLPTRVFHWALALCLVGLIVTGNVGGDAMVLHFRLGHAVLALLLFRLAWGFVGGRWSRFRSFIYGPRALINDIRSRTNSSGRIGHSPAGALSVFAMLAFIAAQVVSGLFSDDEIAFSGPLSHLASNAFVSLATGYHTEIGKLIVLALVLLHLLAIAFYTWRRHRLVSAMVHGDKELTPTTPASRDDALTRLGALLLLLICAGVSYFISRLASPL